MPYLYRSFFVAVCCSVLQCVAVRGSVWQCQCVKCRIFIGHFLEKSPTIIGSMMCNLRHPRGLRHSVPTGAKEANGYLDE